MKERFGVTVIFFTVFIVNFLSLVFQVVWTRKLMVVFGSTALSISTVLTVFLSGIALGGYIGGVWIRRVEDKGRFLGLALILLGAYCLVSLYLLGAVRYPFQYLAWAVESHIAVNLLKLVFSFFILIIPTTIIGAVFPVTTYLYSASRASLGTDVALIYFLDTLGAALGALVCGFVLVPHVGLWTTTMISGALYLLLGLVITLSRTGSGVSRVQTERGAAFSLAGEIERAEKRGYDAKAILILAALFLGGFSALVLEVTWSRYFHLLFGTSIYAFSLVVAAFLLGISAGSILMKRFIGGIRSPLLVFALIEILISGFSLLTMQTSSLVESLYFRTFAAMQSFYVFQAALFMVSFLLMLIPAMLMGANFPLAVSIFNRHDETRAKDVGLTFAVNTSGGIIGAFVAGFLIIPTLGMEKTGILASSVYLALGLVFLLLYYRRPVAKFAVASATAVAVVVLFIVFSEEPSLHYSVYYHGIKYDTLEEFREYKQRSTVLYSRLGHYGLVAVNYDPVNRNYSLLHNGKADASTTGDMATQLFLGHLPLFFHKEPERVLNIGLGGGFTVGAINTHPNVGEVDVVEIDPLVVEATEKFFRDFNNDALADPRVKVHIQDGRHFLETTRKKYDVIVSEPPNIWVSGVSQLFTEEFYRTVDRRLDEGGILIQWVPGYEMEKEDFLMILKTVKKRFEYVTFWSHTGDNILFASHTRPRLDPYYIRALLNIPDIHRDFSKIVPFGDRAMAERLLFSPEISFEMLEKVVEGVDKTNTDDLPYLEFNTARNIFNIAKRKR